MISAPAVSRSMIGTVAANEGTMLMFPGDHRLGTGLRAVLACTGAMSNEDSLRYSHVLNTAARGLLVISGDFGGVAQWANDLSIQRVEATLTWARAQGYATADPVVTLGFSEGNATLLSWARTKAPGDVVGHVSLSGLMDLDAFYTENRGGYAASIDAAYGGDYVPATHGPEHSPLAFATEVAWLPVRTWYSNGDALTLPGDEASFAASHGDTLRRAMPDDPPHGGLTIGAEDLADDVEALLG